MAETPSARLPFGGFNGRLPHVGEEAGDRLVKIANAMACGQPVPPELALWFYRAVKSGLEAQVDAEAPVAINPDRFLRALGLANAVGDDGRYSAIFKAHWAGRFYDIRNRVFPQILHEFETKKRAEGKAWPPKRGSKLYIEWQAVKARHNMNAAEIQLFDEMKAAGVPIPERSTLHGWLKDMQDAHDAAVSAENPALGSGR